MQALVATSRSISQDRIHEREMKKKYDKHLQYVGEISNKKSHPVLQHLKQTETLAKTLYKSKSCAKKFYTTESNAEIKRSNRLLLERIWKIQSNLKCQTTRQRQKLQHVSGSNWHYKKKQAQAIKQQNKRIASHIVNTKLEAKDYKKKIQGEIKEYLQLRKQIRKFKNQDSNTKKTSSKSRKRIESERGIVTLRLTGKQEPNQQLNNQLVEQKNRQDKLPAAITSKKEPNLSNSINKQKQKKSQRVKENLVKIESKKNETTQ